MKAIRFSAEGILNSFRVPFFRTYHLSFLAPPKTTVIGMLVNIMGKPESCFYEILDNNSVQVSVIIEAVRGKAKDLWTYKTYSPKNMGRSVIRRDKLFGAAYTIYVSADKEELLDEIYGALKNPKGIPALGLDDEIVRIRNVELVTLRRNESSKINSIFMDKGYKYKATVKDPSKPIELPMSNIAPLSFSIKLDKEGQRESRKPQEEYKQVEYINCEIELDGVESFTDEINRVVFY